MKPDILNKDWKYIPAAKTNIKATFARLRREARQAERKAVADSHERVLKVRSIGGAK